MYNKLSNLLKILVILSSFLISSLANAKSVMNIQHWQTTNGIPVYFVRANELPMLDVQVAFDAGSARDGKQFGLAALTNNMLNQGTKNLTADQIAEQFDQVGAIYFSTTNHDMAIVGLRSLVAPKYLQPALQTFIHVLTEASFPNDAFQRLQKQTLVAIEQEHQSPMAIAKNTFYKMIYPNHPYGHPVLGNLTTVKALTSDDLIKFYSHYYVATNAIIAMVGDIQPAAAKQIAEAISQQLPKGLPAPSLAMAEPLTSASTKNTFYPSQQTTIFLGQVGITPDNPDYFPLYVGNYTLGGGALVSRLMLKIREQQGLVYGVVSNFFPMRYHGPFIIRLQTRNDQSQNALELTQNILKNYIDTGPTSRELSAAKKNIIDGFPLTIANNSDIIEQLLKIGFYHLPLNYLDTFQDKIKKVNKSQIQQALQRNLNPKNMVIDIVGQQSVHGE